MKIGDTVRVRTHDDHGTFMLLVTGKLDTINGTHIRVSYVAPFRKDAQLTTIIIPWSIISEVMVL